jgi:hypothetical protein
MSASAFSNAKTHQRFRTDEVIVKLLWLALEEHIFLGVEYQGGAGDLFSNAVTEIVIKCRCDVGPRCGRSRNEHAMGKGPRGGWRGFHHLFQLAVELRRFFCSGRGLHNSSLPWRNRAKVGDTVVVDAIVGDEGGEALFKRGGARCKIAAEADAHERDTFRIDTRQCEREVDYGGYDLLPVVAEGWALAMDGPYWPGPSKARTL